MMKDSLGFWKFVEVGWVGVDVRSRVFGLGRIGEISETNLSLYRSERIQILHELERKIKINSKV
jgi:hypothetical protein